MPATTDATMRIVGVASVLGSLTVFIFRLGVWRQEMEHARHNLGAEFKSFHDEMSASMSRIERRLDRLEEGRTPEMVA